MVATNTSMYRAVEGEKTRLRPARWGFSESDLWRRYVWSQDEVLQYWSGSIPGGRSYNHFVSTVAQRDWPNDGRRISYAILRRDTDELIGMVSCYNIDKREGTGEIGIYLGEKEYWGHGYGTDALVTFLGHLFRDLGFTWVYLHTYVSNLRAQKSYIRVGFELRERKRRYAPRVGYHDEVRMTIDRERFEEIHAADLNRIAHPVQ